MTKNKIDARLEQCRAEGRKALITFITSGDGGYDVTDRQFWKWKRMVQT